MGKWAIGPSYVFGPRFSLDPTPMLQSVTQDHFYINATQELVRFANPLPKAGNLTTKEAPQKVSGCLQFSISVLGLQSAVLNPQ